MTSFREILTEEITEGICSILETGGNYFDWVDQYQIPGSDVGRIPIDIGYRMLCNREPPALPGPPFTGGQCTNLRYTVTVYLNAVTTTGAPKPGYPTTTVVLVYGAITGTEVRVTAGVETMFVTSTTADVYAGNLNVPNEHYTEHYIVSAIPQGGVPDTCGNPPPVTPEPDPGYREQPINITYQDNSSTNINLTGNFTFAPPDINIRGELVIPVRIELGGVTIPIKGELNINNPVLNLDFTNVNYPKTTSPNPDCYDSPDDTPDVPPDVPTPVIPPDRNIPEDDTRRIIRAVIVTVTELPDGAGVIYQDDNPDIYIPNLGYVNFQVAIGPSTAWTIDLPVKNKRNLIVCPWDGGAIAVRGTPRAGVEWTLSPVYALEDEVVEFGS